MDNYELYTEATRRLSHRWSRGQWKDGDGNECVLQSIITLNGGQEEDITAIPPLVLEKISSKLKFSPIFWMGNILYKIGNPSTPPEMALAMGIMVWNDVPWRSKYRIMRLFAELAEEYRGEHFEVSAEQLKIKVLRLEAEKKNLVERIEVLEQENRYLWGRLLSKKPLAEAASSLEKLDQDLDETCAELLELA